VGLLRLDVAASARTSRWRAVACRGPVVLGVLAVAAGVAYPIVKSVQRAVAPAGRVDWHGVAATFHGYGLGSAVVNTVILVAVSVPVSVLVATVFAWLNERTDARLGMLSTLLPVLPMLIPPVALAIGWIFLADPRSGFIVEVVRLVASLFGGTVSSLSLGVESMAGLAFLYILISIPLAYVVMAAAFRQLDPSLEEAAIVCGRSRSRTLFTVSIPSVVPAIGSAAILVCLANIGLYSIPATVGLPARISVLSTYIYDLINGSYPPQLQQAAVIGVVLVAVMSLIWLGQARLVRRQRFATVSSRGLGSGQIALGRWRGPARAVVILYVLLSTAAPVIALALVAFERYWNPSLVAGGVSFGNITSFLSLNDAGRAILNSVVLAGVVATGLTLLTAGLAIAQKRLGGLLSGVIGVITKAPAVIPGLVFATAVLIAYGFTPFVLDGTLPILLIAYAIVFIPQAMLPAEAAVEQVGSDLTDASRIAGASAGRTTRRVLLPLMLSGLMAGWAIVFAFIMGDLNVAGILSGPTNPVVGYVLLGVFGNGEGTYSQAAGLGLVLSVVGCVAIGGALLLGRARFRGAGRR
jgi:iron(III) transport system permease protein